MQKKFVKLLLSGLGLGTIAALANPAAIAQRNPSPSIFEQPPFNRGDRATPAALPSPELLTPDRTPISQVQPLNGRVNIKLINQTYTEVVYKELAGETAPRTLAGRSNVTLQNLPTPVNLNFYRPDRGFLIVNLQPSTTATNTLELTLTETADQDLGKTSLVVQPTGEVYLY